MKLEFPKFTVAGLLLCAFLAMSHARGWILLPKIGSRYQPPDPESSWGSYSHK